MNLVRAIKTSRWRIWRNAAGFFAVALAITAAQAQSLTVTTFAGTSSSRGSNDSPGARFTGPHGIGSDAIGNIYVTDGHAVRKITPAGAVTTLAGVVGSAGATDGTGSAARFNSPLGIAVDATGNVFVADSENFTVRKITPAGGVTTFAGLAGTYGPADGTGSAARFMGPRAITFDRSGALYVADSLIVRKITPAGAVTTLAGSAFQFGHVDGPGAGARFSNNLGGIAVDISGNVYVTDWFESTIRKITPSGVVSTYAGAPGRIGADDGTLANARFNFPFSLAIDAGGNLLVGDHNNGLLRRISAAGVVTTVAGYPNSISGSVSYDSVLYERDGVGFEARFGSIYDLAIDPAGNLFICDGGAHTVRKAVSLTAAARVIVPPQSLTLPAGQTAIFTVLANGNPAVAYQWQRSANGATWTDLGDDATYRGTTTALLAVNTGTTPTGDQFFRCIVRNSGGTDTSAPARLTLDAPVVVVPLRISTFAAPGFSAPQGIAQDAAGNLYVVDMFNRQVCKINAAGVTSTVVNNLDQPSDVAVDAAGNVYVADGLACMISKITPAGAVSILAGSRSQRGSVDGTGAGARFNSPMAIAVDGAGTIYVADTYNHTIRRITASGVVTTLAGVAGMSGSADGTGATARFNQPQGLGLDAAGNLYVADWVNHTIRKVTPAGGVTTVAGTPGVSGARDGRAALARFNTPTDVAVDATGNLYVTDSRNNAIRRISTSGIVSTVAGLLPSALNPDTSGRGEGIGNAARFFYPRSLVVNRAGVVFLVDSSNNVVRRGGLVDLLKEGESMMLSTLGMSDDPAVASYQWLKDSVEIVGATSADYALPAARAADSGEYQVRSGAGTTAALSDPVRIDVAGSRIVNLSIRSVAGADAQTLIVGFVVAGDNMPLLIRGIGPTLSQFGVNAPLADPRLTLYTGGSVAGANDNWGGNADVAVSGTRLGAFPLAAGSRDAALLTTLNGGAFTTQCTGVDGTSGVALVELYDASTAGGCRLANVSARTQIGAGEGVLIAGFTVAGNVPRSVLIRGVGPALGAFGVNGAIVDSQLKLFDGASALKAQNDNWSDNTNAAEIAAAAQLVGAFALVPGSKDAVLLLSLAPGSYSAQVSGVGNSTGVGLIEVYEVPERADVASER